jgi:hypothetical protein
MTGGRTDSELAHDEAVSYHGTSDHGTSYHGTSYHEGGDMTDRGTDKAGDER